MEAVEQPYPAQRTRRRACLPAALVLAAALLPNPSLLLAQENAVPPSLERRSAQDGGSGASIRGLRPGYTSLPAQASGEYALGKSGEVIEIAIEDRRLTGYISRLGDDSSDHGTPLTYFFSHSTLHGSQITFSTRAVHGISYSFSGSILPGAPQGSSGRGAFLLVGTFTEHLHEQGKEQRSHVSLPRLGQEMEGR